MSKREAVWTAVFLGVTGTAVGMELVAVTAKRPYRPAWTTLTVRHVPRWVAFSLAGTLSVWLPLHLRKHYGRTGAQG